MNKFNKEAGYDKYDSRIVDMVPAGPRAREKILDLKEKKAKRLRNMGQLDPQKHQKP